MTFKEALDSICIRKYDAPFDAVLNFVTKEDVILICGEASDLYIRSVLYTNSPITTDN